jgi:hypothetical protein
MEQVREAELKAFKPGSASAFLTLTDSLQSVEATESAGDVTDSISITLESTGRPLSGQRITSGDRLEFRTRLAGEPSLTQRFTAMARDITDEIPLAVVFGILISSVLILYFLRSVSEP